MTMYKDIMMTQDKDIMWTLEEGITFARGLEELLRDQGFHVALSGGVLWRGSSIKDLDVIIYPHHSDQGPLERALAPLILPVLDAPWHSCDHTEYDDEKIVMKGLIHGKVIDFFLLQ